MNICTLPIQHRLKISFAHNICHYHALESALRLHIYCYNKRQLTMQLFPVYQPHIWDFLGPLLRARPD